MIEQMTERAAMRGLNPMEYLRWRNELRQDYQQAFDVPAYKPATALGYGWPMGLADGARVPVPTQSREFYEAREVARLEALAKVAP